jgi:predicted DNA binding CopG/RHH family protein
MSNKAIPNFKTEDEEREFWATHDITEYMEEINPVSFPNLKPSTESISLRLPKSVLDRIKMEAHKRDMPYQSLMKAKLYELFDTPNMTVK